MAHKTKKLQRNQIKLEKPKKTEHLSKRTPFDGAGMISLFFLVTFTIVLLMLSAFISIAWVVPPTYLEAQIKTAESDVEELTARMGKAFSKAEAEGCMSFLLVLRCFFSVLFCFWF